MLANNILEKCVRIYVYRFMSKLYQPKTYSKGLKIEF